MTVILNTKLYLHDRTVSMGGTLPGATSLSGVTPTISASGASTNRVMDPHIGATQASTGNVGQSQVTTAQTTWLRRFVSPELMPQSITGGNVWTLRGGFQESNANENCALGFRLYTWRPSTGATVSTLITLSTLSAEPGTGQTDTSSNGTAAAGPFAVSFGDILVCEVWDSHTSGKASPYTMAFTYDGATEGSTAGSNAAYLLSPVTLRFFSPTSGANYADPGAFFMRRLARTWRNRLRSGILVPDIWLPAPVQS